MSLFGMTKNPEKKNVRIRPAPYRYGRTASLSLRGQRLERCENSVRLPRHSPDNGAETSCISTKSSPFVYFVGCRLKCVYIYIIYIYTLPELTWPLKIRPSQKETRILVSGRVPLFFPSNLIRIHQPACIHEISNDFPCFCWHGWPTFQPMQKPNQTNNFQSTPLILTKRCSQHKIHQLWTHQLPSPPNVSQQFPISLLHLFHFAIMILCHS